MTITTFFSAAGFCLIVSLLPIICKCSFVKDEESLRTDLFSNYDSKVRPQMKTDISAGLVLCSLDALNIAKQFMSMITMIEMKWTDARLAWNPANYGGLTSLVTAPEDVWTPPVVIENAIQDVGVIGGEHRDATPLRILYSGFVAWTPVQETSTSCRMTITHYPFDTQRCTIVLVGWTYPLSEMNISPVAIDWTTLYVDSGEFDLIDVAMYQSDLSPSSPPNETYRKLQFEITFRRKWEFYGQNLILPIVLNSILMNVVFVLPIESGEKMGYSLTVLLTYIVFLTWVTDNLPPVSTDTSILQVYLAIVLAMGCLATVLTTWVLHLYHTNPDKPMGKFYRAIASKLLVPFTDYIHCRRKKKTRVEDEDVYDLELPGRKVNVGSMPTRPSSGRSKVCTVADHSLTFDRFETLTKFSLVDTRQDDRCDEWEATPTYTWQELAKLYDCFFMWTFAGAMTVLTAIVLSLLYESY